MKSPGFILFISFHIIFLFSQNYIVISSSVMMLEKQIVNDVNEIKNDVINLTNINDMDDSFENKFALIQFYIEKNHIDKAIDILENEMLLKFDIQNDRLKVEILQLLGALYFKINNVNLSYKYLDKAITQYYDIIDNPIILSNYVECVRSMGGYDKAIENSIEFLKKFPNNEDIAYNGAIAALDMDKFEQGLELLNIALNTNKFKLDYWHKAADVYIQIHKYHIAKNILIQALEYHPDNFDLMYHLGLIFQHMSDYDNAIKQFNYILNINSSRIDVKSSKCSILQVLGLADETLKCYHEILPYIQNDAGTLNNYGGFLEVIGHHDEAILYLDHALSINPNLTQALINAGGHYQDKGQVYLADRYFSRVQYLDTMNLADIRRALTLSPVSCSQAQMISERIRLIGKLYYLSQIVDSSQSFQRRPLGATLDRVPFYVVYHGYNDRIIMELLGTVYRKHIQDLSMFTTDVSNIVSLQEKFNKNIKSKIRVGFISKFFGVYEPHGLLLDGIMKYLPRHLYYVIAIAIAMTDGKPLSYTVQNSVDGILYVSLNREYTIQQIKEINLDILIFADTLSEPQNHFLAHSRIAPIQIAFWGNPITSGSCQIDYFISSDDMEHPFRTRLLTIHDPYVEQVILLKGQGIWYHSPNTLYQSIKNANPTLALKLLKHSDAIPDRTSLNIPLKGNAFVFLCAQSTFKIHPSYDNVLINILLLHPSIYIVLTKGRKKRWTDIYTSRIHLLLKKRINEINIKTKISPSSSVNITSKTFDTSDEFIVELEKQKHINYKDIMKRLIFIKRVSAQHFDKLMLIADCLLHPFPFDGSRTSYDGLSFDIPILTLPSEYLRGRMGHMYYRTINLPEIVAHNVSEYIHIAKKLVSNFTFYNKIRNQININKYLIWEDMEVPFEWTNTLSTIMGIPKLSWNEFIKTTDKNNNYERKLKQKREKNRTLFSQNWGKEYHLLSNEKISELECIPQIIENNNSKSIELGNVINNHHYHLASIRLGFIPQEPKLTLITSSIKSNTTTISIPLTTITNDIYFTIKPRIFNDWHDNTSIIWKYHNQNKIIQKEKMSKLWERVSFPRSTAPSLGEIKALILRGLHGDAIKGLHQIIDLYIIGSNINSDLCNNNENDNSNYNNDNNNFLMKNGLSQLKGDLDLDSLEEVARASYELGGLYYLKGNFTQAVKFCEQAVKLIPSFTSALGCAGIAGVYLTNVSDAIFNLKKGIVHDSYNINNNSNNDNDDDVKTSYSVILTKIANSSPVHLPQEQLIESYLKALWKHGHYDLCLKESSNLLNIQFYTNIDTHLHSNDMNIDVNVKNTTNTGLSTQKGGMYILLLSILDLEFYKTEYFYQKYDTNNDNIKLKLLQKKLEGHKKLKVSHKTSLQNEIIKIQRFYPNFIDIISNCLRDNINTVQHYLDASNEIMQLYRRNDVYDINAFPFDTYDYDSDYESKSIEISEFILITPYWKSKFKHILEDAHTALIKNLINRHIINIYLLCEHSCIINDFINLGFPNINKLILININDRAKFSDAFNLINEISSKYNNNGNSNKNNLNYIICNSDIYFDESLKFINKSVSLSENVVFALSKWYQRSDDVSNMEVTLRTDSQDAWIIMSLSHSTNTTTNNNNYTNQNLDSVIPNDLIDDANFYLGASRCDNVLANILEKYGYIVKNPAIKIHAIEINSGPNLNSIKVNNEEKNNHLEDRNLYTTENAVPGNISRIFLS